MSHKNTSCWASVQKYQIFPCKNSNRSDFVFHSLTPVQSLYLWPRSNSPLGGAGVPVAWPSSFGPVVVAVFIMDGARGVVVWRLDAADRAYLHPRLSTWFAAVLPLPCHPTGEHRERNRETGVWREVKMSQCCSLQWKIRKGKDSPCRKSFSR